MLALSGQTSAYEYAKGMDSETGFYSYTEGALRRVASLVYSKNSKKYHSETVN